MRRQSRVPNLEFDPYRVVSRNKEAIPWAFFDRQTYVSASTTSLTFFATQTSGINGNLPLGGQLPADTQFKIMAIRIGILSDTRETAVAAPAAGPTETVIEDVKELSYDGTAKLTVGDKEYGRWPIFMLPAGGGPYGNLSVPGFFITSDKTAQYSFATNGPPDPRAVYSLPIYIVIPEQYHFRVVLEWDAAKTLNAGNTPIVAILDGVLKRPRQ